MVEGFLLLLFYSFTAGKIMGKRKGRLVLNSKIMG